jgi:hypothetical protein
MLSSEDCARFIAFGSHTLVNLDMHYLRAIFAGTPIDRAVYGTTMLNFSSKLAIRESNFEK